MTVADRFTVEGYREHYATMSDAALEQVIADIGNLVPNAREALRVEMEHRHLPPSNLNLASEPFEDLNNVGGWLLYYCVSSVLLLPLGTLGSLAQYPIWIVALVLPSNVLQFIAGILLWKRNPRSLKWVRLSLLCFFAFALLVCLSLLFLRDAFQAGEGVVTMLIGSIPSILWWRYFRVSKRVHAVFGRNMAGLWTTTGGQA